MRRSRRSGNGERSSCLVHPLSRRHSPMSTRSEDSMRRSRGPWWWVAIAGAAIAASGCSGCPSTKLDLTLHGGFGYVLNPDFTVEAGFMRSIDERSSGGCYVPQLGVDLIVDDGQITSPANWPTTFEVTDKIVTFDGAGTGAVGITGVLGPHLKNTNASVTATSMANLAKKGPGNATIPTPHLSEGDWR